MADKKPEAKKGEAKKGPPKKGRFKQYAKGKTKNKSCPKCGEGYYMAGHEDRSYCGKCHYTEFSMKK